MNNLHIVYGPPMSGKSLNAKAIRDRLECDEVFDYNQQDQIRDALQEGLKVLVLSTEEKPKTFRGHRHLFDGALATHISVFRTLLGASWDDGSAPLTTFIVVRRVSLFHQGWCFKKPVYDGKNLMVFNSRKDAKNWTEAHPFTGDPHDVIKHIKYQIVAHTQDA